VHLPLVSAQDAGGALQAQSHCWRDINPSLAGATLDDKESDNHEFIQINRAPVQILCISMGTIVSSKVNSFGLYRCLAH
jgi:hypothetical protein